MPGAGGGGGCHGCMQGQEHRDHCSETVSRRGSKVQMAETRGLAWLQGNSLQIPRPGLKALSGPHGGQRLGSAGQCRGHGFNPWSWEGPTPAGVTKPGTGTTAPEPACPPACALRWQNCSGSPQPAAYAPRWMGPKGMHETQHSHELLQEENQRPFGTREPTKTLSGLKMLMLSRNQLS